MASEWRAYCTHGISSSSSSSLCLLYTPWPSPSSCSSRPGVCRHVRCAPYSLPAPRTVTVILRIPTPRPSPTTGFPPGDGESPLFWGFKGNVGDPHREMCFKSDPTRRLPAVEVSGRGSNLLIFTSADNINECIRKFPFCRINLLGPLPGLHHKMICHGCKPYPKR